MDFGDLGQFDLDTLDHDAKVGIITSLLPGFIEEGFSANASLDILKDNGLGIARSEFLDLYREILGIEQQENRVRFVAGYNIPSLNTLVDAELPIDQNYKFVFRYDYISGINGELEQGYIGIDRNILDTVGNMEADAFDEIIERYPERIAELINVDIWKGFKNSR
jgi:hypothetical protein